MGEIVYWLFNTRGGMFALIGGGIVLCALIAFLLERRTRKMYYEHTKASKGKDGEGGILGGLFDFGDDEEEDENAEENGEDSSLGSVFADIRKDLDDWDPDAPDGDEGSAVKK